MSKKILFCSLFILIFLMPSKQDSNAETWERHNTTVDADSILAAIDRGDSIIIDSCEIFGRLTKEGTGERPDTLKSFIDISCSTFHGTVSFIKCYFMRRINLDADTFIKMVTFSPVYVLADGTYILLSWKNGERTFFGEFADFSHSTFWEFANFGNVKFWEGADFSNTTFCKVASFNHTFFYDTANFAYVTFARGASFGEAAFGGDADFSVATFGGYTDFSVANFVEQVKLTPEQFENIYISWNQLKGHLDYGPPDYYELMKHFEEQRQLADADGVYLFLKNQERIKKFWLWRYLEYWFIQLTCGYGRKPLNTFVLSVALVILFAIFFTNSKAIKEIERDFRHRRRPRIFREIPKNWRKRFYYALYFSLHTFIIGVVSDWHATDEFLINTKRIKRFRFRTLSMIEGALGWILVIILIISLERTIGR